MVGRAAAMVVALVVAVAVTLAVSGCGSAAPSSTAAAPGRHVIALVAGAEPGGVAVGAALRCGARREAARLGYRLSVPGPPVASASAQILAVDEIIAAGTDAPAAAILAPGTADALAAPIRSLRSAGITVVAVDAASHVPGGAALAYRQGVGAVRRAVSALERRPIGDSRLTGRRC